MLCSQSDLGTLSFSHPCPRCIWKNCLNHQVVSKTPECKSSHIRKDLLVSPALRAPSVSPLPPSERPVVTAGSWAGSEQTWELQPPTASAPHVTPLLSQAAPRLLCPGSCPGFPGCDGKVTLCVWPWACMLDVVINALWSWRTAVWVKGCRAP